MPSGRRRTNSRLSKLPIRVTLYRPSKTGSFTSPPNSGRLDRAAVQAQLKNSQRNSIYQRLPSTAIVSAERLLLILPIPPSINHQYATVNGRRLLSSAGRAYKTQVGQQIWVALAQSPARASLMNRLQSGSLALSIRFFFTSALRRDVDGGLKIAQDALCEGLGLNDNRIIETHLYKNVDKTHPRIEVSLSLAALSSH
jgi:crossover junction endodeoxyribonuclease RusA